MQKFRKKIVSLLLVIVLTVSLAGANVQNVNAYDESKNYVTVMIDVSILGQGFYVVPTLVEVQDGETAADVSVRLFDQLGLEYQNTGDIASGTFYLSALKGADNGEVNIPSWVEENGGPSNDSNDGNDDEYLGEFDYSSMSGWMITVNDILIPVGASAYEVGEGDVIRWMFTAWGYGADLGYSGFGTDPYITANDKSDLYIALAEAKDAGYTGSEYQKAIEVACNLEASDLTIATEIYKLEKAVDEADKTDDPAGTAKDLGKSIVAYEEGVMKYLSANVIDPQVGSIGGEWAVLALARSGYATDEFKEAYLKNVKTKLDECSGELSTVKSTEYSRVIIGLSALGQDAASFNGYDLIKPLADFDFTKKQGINGAIYALIALDTKNYAIPTCQEGKTQNSREEMIKYILGKEIAGGGWSLSGTSPDPDITAMTIQSLAPYYNSKAEVKKAVDESLEALSGLQNETGGYASWGTVNSESIAQVICALCSIGIDPVKDERFIKADGSWLLSALTAFATTEAAGIGFKHITSGTVNQMATEQCAYALCAYNRLLNGKSGLYQMSDVQTEITLTGDTATITAPTSIDNIKGTSFQVNLVTNTLQKDLKMFDVTLTLSSLLDVESVSVNGGLAPENLNWNKDEKNTLRIVYSDLNTEKTIDTAEKMPLKLISIKCNLKAAGTDGSTVGISLDAFHQNTTVEEQVDYVKTPITKSITLQNGMSVDTSVLYTGDGKDFIPKDKKAVKVVFTGMAFETEEEIGFTAGDKYIKLYKSKDFTDKDSVNTYLMLADTSITEDELNEIANYSVYEGTTGGSILFGDTNNDQVIDAQDALNEVNMWLRKSKDEVTSSLILSYNVNGDEKLNNIDALAIVEFFINKYDFGILKTEIQKVEEDQTEASGKDEKQGE